LSHPCAITSAGPDSADHRFSCNANAVVPALIRPAVNEPVDRQTCVLDVDADHADRRVGGLQLLQELPVARSTSMTNLTLL